ncbi:hypothetical protein IEO21_03217 [Rhodonia placenta]|uniref:Uncharacterized protein n=1 Tax=Rhodonia placenta TaxID=104341 RepID=A0A8H7P6L4_9APHY|nr:hypothetical protein IEO21_03217 [Postia placenta]
MLPSHLTTTSRKPASWLISAGRSHAQGLNTSLCGLLSVRSLVMK